MQVCNKLNWSRPIISISFLFSSLGMDCTNAFEDVGHSSSAYEMLKDFYIGDLVESSVELMGKNPIALLNAVMKKRNLFLVLVANHQASKKNKRFFLWYFIV